MKLHAIGLTLLCAFSTLQSNPLKIKTALVVTGAAAAYAYTGYCLHKVIKTDLKNRHQYLNKKSCNNDTPYYECYADELYVKKEAPINSITKNGDTEWF